MSTLESRIKALERRAATRDAGRGLRYVSVEVSADADDAEVDAAILAAWRARGYDEVPPCPPCQRFHSIVIACDRGGIE
jgi:hypothetical protein